MAMNISPCSYGHMLQFIIPVLIDICPLAFHHRRWPSIVSFAGSNWWLPIDRLPRRTPFFHVRATNPYEKAPMTWPYLVCVSPKNHPISRHWKPPGIMYTAITYTGTSWGRICLLSFLLYICHILLNLSSTLTTHVHIVFTRNLHPRIILYYKSHVYKKRSRKPFVKEDNAPNMFYVCASRGTNVPETMSLWQTFVYYHYLSVFIFFLVHIFCSLGGEDRGSDGGGAGGLLNL